MLSIMLPYLCFSCRLQRSAHTLPSHLPKQLGQQGTHLCELAQHASSLASPQQLFNGRIAENGVLAPADLNTAA